MSDQQFKKPGDPFAGLAQKQAPAFKKPDFGLPDKHDAARLAGIKDLDLDKLEKEEEERALAKEKAEEEAKQEAERKSAEELEEAAQQRAQERAERRRRMKMICFCGNDVCRIGPFTLAKQVDE